MASEGWNRTAVMISAIGTLLAGVAAAFAFGLDWLSFGGDSPTDDETSYTVDGSPIPKISEQVLWREKVLLDGSLDADDDEGPLRGGYSGTDIYYWGDDEISASYGMVPWDPKEKATANGCAKKLRALGTANHFIIKPGDKYCARTDKGRTVLVVPLSESNGGWEADVTVFADRS